MNDKPYDPDYSAAFATPPAGPPVGPQLTEYTGNRIASALERIADAMERAASGGGVQSYTDMRAAMMPQAEAVKGMQPDMLRVHLPESFTVTSNKAT